MWRIVLRRSRVPIRLHVRGYLPGTPPLVRSTDTPTPEAKITSQATSALPTESNTTPSPASLGSSPSNAVNAVNTPPKVESLPRSTANAVPPSNAAPSLKAAPSAPSNAPPSAPSNEPPSAPPSSANVSSSNSSSSLPADQKETTTLPNAQLKTNKSKPYKPTYIPKATPETIATEPKATLEITTKSPEVSTDSAGVDPKSQATAIPTITPTPTPASTTTTTTTEIPPKTERPTTTEASSSTSSTSAETPASSSTASSATTSTSTGAYQRKPSSFSSGKFRLPDGFAPAEPINTLKVKEETAEEEEDDLGYQKPENTHQKQTRWQRILQHRGKILFLCGAVLLFLNKDQASKLFMKGVVINYLNWADEPTFFLTVLTVAAQAEGDLHDFIFQGGVPALIHLAKNSPSEEGRLGALTALHAMSANPFVRRDICDIYPEFVSEILGLVSMEATPSNKSTIGAALNVLYNYLGDHQWFYDQFMQLKGFDVLMKCMKSPEPEISNFSSQLVGVFLMENYEWFKAQKFKDVGAVFNALGNMAAVYQEAGKPEYALKVYQCIMHIDNKNPMILTQMGLEMIKVGRDEEGTTWLLKSLELNPRQLDAAFALAKHTLKSDSSDATIKAAINVLLQGLPELKRVNSAQFADGKHPLAPKVYSLLVDLYLKLGDLEAALEMAQDWSAYSVADAIALTATGKILMEQGEYREALGPLGAAVRLNSRLPVAHYYRARCLASLKRDDLALVVCKEGMQVDRELRVASEQRIKYTQSRADQVSSLVDYYAYDEKKLKEILRIMNEAKRAEKEKPEILAPLYLLGGKLLYSSGQKKEAVECYDTLIQAAPDNVKGYLHKAQALNHMEGQPKSLVYNTYSAGFCKWLAAEKKKQSEEQKAEAKSSKAQKSKRKKKEDESRTLLLKIDRRCVSKPVAKEAQAERDDMCKVAHELKELLQKGSY